LPKLIINPLKSSSTDTNFNLSQCNLPNVPLATLSSNQPDYNLSQNPIQFPTNIVGGFFTGLGIVATVAVMATVVNEIVIPEIKKRRLGNYPAEVRDVETYLRKISMLINSINNEATKHIKMLQSRIKSLNSAESNVFGIERDNQTTKIVKFIGLVRDSIPNFDRLTLEYLAKTQFLWLIRDKLKQRETHRKAYVENLQYIRRRLSPQSRNLFPSTMVEISSRINPNYLLQITLECAIRDKMSSVNYNTNNPLVVLLNPDNQEQSFYTLQVLLGIACKDEFAKKIGEGSLILIHSCKDQLGNIKTYPNYRYSLVPSSLTTTPDNKLKNELSRIKVASIHSRRLGYLSFKPLLPSENGVEIFSVPKHLLDIPTGFKQYQQGWFVVYYDEINRNQRVKIIPFDANVDFPYSDRNYRYYKGVSILPSNENLYNELVIRDLRHFKSVKLNKLPVGIAINFDRSSLTPVQLLEQQFSLMDKTNGIMILPFIEPDKTSSNYHYKVEIERNLNPRWKTTRDPIMTSYPELETQIRRLEILNWLKSKLSEVDIYTLPPNSEFPTIIREVTAKHLKQPLFLVPKSSQSNYFIHSIVRKN
jgi:hypothetical protein